MSRALSRASALVVVILTLGILVLAACEAAPAAPSPSPTSAIVVPTPTAAPRIVAATASPTNTLVPVPSPTMEPTVPLTVTPIPVAPTDTPAPTSTPALAAATETPVWAAPTATQAASTPTATEEPFRGSRQPVVVQRDLRPPFPNLITVRAASHARFDRVVFEFRGDVPGYRVEQVKPPIIADPSGLPVKVAGNAFLAVRFEPAQAHDDAGNATSDTRGLAPGLPNLMEVKQTGDFEAVLSWVLGLDHPADFAVYELRSPSRVVIDVAH